MSGKITLTAINNSTNEIIHSESLFERQLSHLKAEDLLEVIQRRHSNYFLCDWHANGTRFSTSNGLSLDTVILLSNTFQSPNWVFFWRMKGNIQIDVKFKRETITVEISESDTIAEAKQKIQVVTKIPVSEQRLFFNLNELDNSRIVNGCNIQHESTLNLRQIIEGSPEQETYGRLFILTMTRKTIEVEYASFDTISHIKQKIEEAEGIPFDQQRLIYAGKQLEDGLSVDAYKIKADCTLHLIKRLQGVGGPIPLTQFLELSTDSVPAQITFSNDSPAWRRLNPGLNIEGLCTNGTCTASGKLVLTGHGFKIFDIELDTQTNRCPSCSKYVKPTSYGFFDCEYRTWGIVSKSRDDPPKNFRSEWNKAPRESYTTLPKEPNGTSEHARLIIETRASQTAASTRECPICLTGIKETYQSVCCNEPFHRACFENWISRGHKCLLCRAIDTPVTSIKISIKKTAPPYSTINMELISSSLVLKVKERIRDVFGISIRRQMLLFYVSEEDPVVLEDEKTLVYYGVRGESDIRLVVW